MIDYDLKRIRGIAFDVDGVLSANTISLSSSDGMPVRTANIKDGYALQLAVKSGLHLAIITGGKSQSVYRRYDGLGVRHIYQGVSYKLPVLTNWMGQLGLKPEEVAYVGDDIPDYHSMLHVGLACCPVDAAPEICSIARYVSPLPGGQGCVRDILEQVMRAQGLWMSDVKAFGW